MDLRLYGRVLWRYRVLILVGWVIACLAAFLAIVKIDGDGLTYRQSETYSAQEDIYVTERGFPEGRTTIPGVDDTSGESSGEFASPDRLGGLATVYVELVDSDAVHELMLEDGPLAGEVIVDQFTFDSGRGALPALRITAFADSAAGAFERARRQSAAFREYIADQQERVGIPEGQRVVLTVLRQADSAEVVEGRSLTNAVVVFVGILAVFVGLAFVLHNLRTGRRRRDGEPWPDQGDHDLSPDAIIGSSASEGDVRVPDRREER